LNIFYCSFCFYAECSIWVRCLSLACKVFCNSLTACPLSPFVRLLLLTGADLDCTGCFCSVTEVSFVIGSEPGLPLAEAPPASIEEKTNAVASVVETKYFLTEYLLSIIGYSLLFILYQMTLTH